MTIYRRYILSHFGRLLLLSLGAFTGLYLLVDFFDKIDNFIEHQAHLEHYLLYFANLVPMVIPQVVPLAILTAVFLTLGGLSRTNELTALRAGGLSLWQLTAPLLAVAMLVTLAVLAANEYVVPLSTRKANHVLRVEVKGKEAVAIKRDRLWFREGDAIINVDLSLPEQNRLQGISIYRFGPDFRLVERSEAEEAFHNGLRWDFRNLARRRFDPETGDLTAMEKFPLRPLSLAKEPEDFKQSEAKTEELGIRRLKQLITTLQREGYDTTRYRVDLQARIATPFASFIMAFLGIPFALQKGRGSSLAMGMGLSLAVGILFHIVQATLVAFGYSSALPPLVAAWGGNLLFLLAGIYLLLSTRE